MSIVQLAYNAVTAKVFNASKEVKLEVQRVLSYRVAGCEHMAAFQSGGWDGRSSFFDYAAGTFPRGFATLVYHALVKAGHRVQLVKKPLPEPLGPEFPVVDSFGEDPRYDYQRQIVEKLTKHGQIIAQVATGGGKSRIARLCTERIGRPTLFLTTRSVLMYQMASSYEAMGKKVAILGDGKLEISKEVTCGMVQTIISWLKEPDEKMNEPARRKQLLRREKMIEALSRFEFVILEEAHEVSGNGFFEILRHCKNAHYRLSLTATPFMKDSEEANMRLMASSGPVAIRISEKTLIDRGILAKPYFKFVKLPNKPAKLYRSTPWQRAYEVGVAENEYRNRAAVAEAIRGVRYGLSVMMLVQRKEHGKTLCETLRKAGIRADYIYGEDNQTERQAALNNLRDGIIDVLIGSTILDVGVDVPAIGLVILAGGGKAEVAIRQRIGRGLREKKGFLFDGTKMPNVAFIVDFADDHNSHLKGHYKQRRHIIENTEGFGENIVDDFDYVGLGFKKVA